MPSSGSAYYALRIFVDLSLENFFLWEAIFLVGECRTILDTKCTHASPFVQFLFKLFSLGEYILKINQCLNQFLHEYIGKESYKTRQSRNSLVSASLSM